MSWPEVHGAVTHFPVALLVTAFVYEIGGLVLRRPAWRIVSFWLLVAAVVMAVPSLVAGWMTGSELFGGIAHPPAEFLWHRGAAFTAAGTALLLLIWRVMARDHLGGRALAGSAVLMLIAATAVGIAGYLGGEMVFGGAAPTGPAAAAPPPPPGAPPAPAAGVPAALAPGRPVFRRICARCHGANAEGKIGPKLAGSFLEEAQIEKTVTHGIAPRMPAFGGQLSPAEIKAVAAYVHWLATNP